MNLSNGNDMSANEFSANLSGSLFNGNYSQLYKRITGVTINDPAIRAAFESFISMAEHPGSFSISELLFGTETIIKGHSVSPADGNIIICIDRVGSGKHSKKLLKNSVGGIYALFDLRNGVSLDIDKAGGSLPAGETKRFAVVPPRKAKRIFSYAQKEGVKAVECGALLASDKLIIMRGGEVIASVDKSFSHPSDSISVVLGENCRAEFESGYNAAAAYSSCRCVSENVIIRFGLAGGIEAVCSRALGYFAAMSYLKSIPVNIVFTNESNCTVAVPRPQVADGDYLYLLKLRAEADGTPSRIHHGQLNYYLSVMKKQGKIKDVLPIKENVDSVIDRLCGDSLEYVSLTEIPDKCFGVIVSVGRGESVNGVKLGYFKNIE